jgi:hypothetical protein
VKWYLRSHDPRAHFGGGGHARRAFTAIAVCPHAALFAPLATGLKRQGFLNVAVTAAAAPNKAHAAAAADASSPQIAGFFETVAGIVVDDTARRVPVSATGGGSDSAADANSSDAAPAPPMFPGDVLADPWTSDDAKGGEAYPVLWPHLTKQIHRPLDLPSSPTHARMLDNAYVAQFAKSHFAAGL